MESLERLPSGPAGRTDESSGSGGATGGGVVGRLDLQLKDLEQQMNKSRLHTQQSCSNMKDELKTSVHRELEGLRAHFLGRLDYQFSRITAAETDLGLLKDQLDNQHRKLLSLENDTSLLAWRTRMCGCSETEEDGRSAPHGGSPTNKTGGWSEGKEAQPPGQVGGASGANEQGRPSGKGGERGNTTEKSLEWRVVANENQIRHFSTRLKDLSVSGDSLTTKVRTTLPPQPPASSWWMRCFMFSFCDLAKGFGPEPRCLPDQDPSRGSRRTSEPRGDRGGAVGAGL